MDSRAEIYALRDTALNTVKRRDALNRLMENQDFQMLFLEGYMKDEVIRLVKERAVVGMDSVQGRTCLQQIDAISFFQLYINTIHQDAEIAVKTIMDCDEALKD